ncbi:PAS domain-containing sensor histidine kinase [Notoacmeibacter marinus]|uniref:histidine kinase n=1 Tax=Notoacmeibacter marinus TaxID=1876515 RepID=A0A231UT34_9HYPH|nr:PAS domain-containing sensor histidine kinase [Notoacmeibacter marinus]OXS99053.1 PAS domain-containing sensor histidine kinase [Notoacmeibacter marinus]
MTLAEANLADDDSESWGDRRRVSVRRGASLIILTLIVALASFTVLTGLTPIDPDRNTTIVLIVINLVLVGLLVWLIGRELVRIIAARRRGRAAARLHVRLVALFALVAALPAIMIAVFASVTLNIGLDRWFEIRTRTIINSSLAIADAYVRENAANLQGTTLAMSETLDNNRTTFILDKTGFRALMTRQAQGRALAHAALIDSTGAFVMQAETTASFAMPIPPQEAVDRAADGMPVMIEPRLRNIVGAIIKLRELEGLYLFTVRLVDPQVIRARQIVGTNVGEYRTLEANRATSQIAFGLLYLGVTLVVILSAIWTGIAVADRLVRPIRQLIGAADEVKAGNLRVTVPVRPEDGDMANLGQTFNEMVHRLDSQRNDLLEANHQVDERRRFSEAVLAGVTAGVIGIDEDGHITIANRAARRNLSIGGDAIGKNLSHVLPRIGRVFEIARRSGRPVFRDTVTFIRGGTERTYNVRITMEEAGEDSEHSWVVTVDDISDLVQAQRSTAWADVARRIAHEIKNPLTPIQLSTERIQRRYGRKLTEDREVFDQCTETIIRQVDDIKRMVDEFSAFARMPKPQMELSDLRDVLREATFLVEVSRDEIEFELALGDDPLMGTFDRRLLGQVFGNLIKNAAEAIDTARGTEPDLKGAIRVEAEHRGEMIEVRVLDNGCGLPGADRQKLLEPYMTTRVKGTGLGLAIVRKIVEEHAGGLGLHDAPARFHGGRGAMIVIQLPARDVETPPARTNAEVSDAS